MLKQPVYTLEESRKHRHYDFVPPENPDMRAISRLLGLPAGSDVVTIIAEIKHQIWPATAIGYFHSPKCEEVWAKLAKYIDLSPCKKDETLCPLTQIERVLRQTPLVNRSALFAVANAITDGRIKPDDKKAHEVWLNRVASNPDEGGALLNSARPSVALDRPVVCQKFHAIVVTLLAAGVPKSDAITAARVNNPDEYAAWLASGGSQI